MIARFFVDLQIVINAFHTWNPFDATQKTGNFSFQYWSAEADVAIFYCNFDSARMSYYPAKL